MTSSLGCEVEDTVHVTLGDAILFDARTLHRSTPFPPCDLSSDSTNVSLRLAIGIQWLTPGGLDGLRPGTYFRWPSSDIPTHVNLQDIRRRKVFGMDTAGWFFKRALVKVDTLPELVVSGVTVSDFAELSDEVIRSYCTLRLAETYADSAFADKLTQAGCEDVASAQIALRRYILMRRATLKHFGETQGPDLFNQIYEWIIKPVLQL